MSRIALPSDAFRLGDVVVVPSLNRLVRSDRTDDIEPRVMRVLAALAETPGEVVTRAGLFEIVWPETVVNDEALTRAVSELRKALGDGAPGAIETIRGTGYRLARPISPLAPPPETAAAPALPGERASRSPRGSLTALALALAACALAVAVWAAWPRVARDAVRAAPAAGTAPDRARLDSTSEYYRPGMSEFGVYYDSTAGTYFEFVDPAPESGGSSGSVLPAP